MQQKTKDLYSDSAIVKFAKDSITAQGEALLSMAETVSDSFVKAVRLILESKGRVVITGVGKSAIIANKIVATLNSTGTPSLFMHAADAIHGDLGLVQSDDIVICISKSGNTPEIKVLTPLLKKSGNPLISITGNTKSFLAKQSDYVLNSYVEKEVCPNNLAPTTSTTAQLVIGDALAICLLELRGFGKNDFAKFHPGGALGKKLFLTVEELAKQNEQPKVASNSSIKEVILEISQKRLGMTAVVDQDKLVGIITDGDLRRMLETNTNISELRAADIMTRSPKTISIKAMAVEAMKKMELSEISHLIVVEGTKFAGVIHIHDLIKEGI